MIITTAALTPAQSSIQRINTLNVLRQNHNECSSRKWLSFQRIQKVAQASCCSRCLGSAPLFVKVSACMYYVLAERKGTLSLPGMGFSTLASCSPHLVCKDVWWNEQKWEVFIHFKAFFTKVYAAFNYFIRIRLILWDYSSRRAGSDQQWSSWYQRREGGLGPECCLEINLISCNQSTGTADISSQRITLEQTFILPASKNRTDCGHRPAS